MGRPLPTGYCLHRMGTAWYHSFPVSSTLPTPVYLGRTTLLPTLFPWCPLLYLLRQCRPLSSYSVQRLRLVCSMDPIHLVPWLFWRGEGLAYGTGFPLFKLLVGGSGDASLMGAIRRVQQRPLRFVICVNGGSLLVLRVATCQGRIGQVTTRRRAVIQRVR